MSDSTETDDEGAVLNRKGKHQTSSQPPSPEKKRRSKESQPTPPASEGESGSDREAKVKAKSLFGKLRQEKKNKNAGARSKTSSKGFEVCNLILFFLRVLSFEQISENKQEC